MDVGTWLREAKGWVDSLDADLIALNNFAPEGADRSWLVSNNVVKITTFMNIAGSISEVKPKLMALGCQNATFLAGVDELAEVMEILELKLGQTINDADGGFKVDVTADMLIVRGLDYYTGTVFETFAANHREIGSLCSGGRYENLASNYTDQKFPGVGGSIGLTRLFWILQN